LDTAIEAIGKTEQGKIGVPQAAENVAWYSQGITPGEMGNAVISGHVDTKAGRAVFWRLRELAVGDQVIVFDDAGVERTFVVIERTLYPYDKAPIHKIFGFDLERDLNLITCAGRWNPRTRNYSQRLVVYTRLVSEKFPNESR
jgi:sortase (surface protein transpeptidase)